MEARGVRVCAIQDHRLTSVAGWDQSTYKMWFEPCSEGPNGGSAGGVGWAVRVGKEPCASVAHLPGSGPFVKLVTLSVENTGVGGSTFDLASVYVPRQGAMSHAAIREEVLGMLEATQGHKAALMGDVNCDMGDSSPGAYAWGQALNATGYVAIDRVGKWGETPSRFPRGDQPGEPRHIDTVVVSGPGMVQYDPHVVAIGTTCNTEVDTSGYGTCPVVPGPECPDCKCIEHQHSDRNLVVWDFEAELRPARAKRPDQLRWKMDDLLENKERQAAYAKT